MGDLATELFSLDINVDTDSDSDEEEEITIEEIDFKGNKKTGVNKLLTNAEIKMITSRDPKLITSIYRRNKFTRRIILKALNIDVNSMKFVKEEISKLKNKGIVIDMETMDSMDVMNLGLQYPEYIRSILLISSKINSLTLGLSC